jgi:hypothetical protein
MKVEDIPLDLIDVGERRRTTFVNISKLAKGMPESRRYGSHFLEEQRSNKSNAMNKRRRSKL